MSDQNKDTNKVHEEAEKLAHKQQDLAVMSEMSGEDASAKYGVIANGAGKAIAAGNEATATEQKKQKEFYRYLFLQSLIKDLDKMFDDIDSMIDDFQASVDLSNRLIKARQENDIDEMKHILSTEYDINTDGKTNEQICDLTDEKIETEIKNQIDLEKAIKAKSEEIKSKIEGLDPKSPDTAKLKEQYQNDFDENMARFEKIASAKGLKYEEARSNVVSTFDSKNEQFSNNQLEARGQKKEELAKEARSTSYSTAITEDDPFAEVASITDPFNAVATNMGYDSNDLNATQPKPDAEIKTDLNAINKPVVLGMN